MSNSKNNDDSQQGANFSNANFNATNNSKFENFGNTYNNTWHQQAEFLKRENLEDYKQPKFPTPQNADSRIEYLRNHRVLILGGNHEDKSDLALYLAGQLQDATVWEWTGNGSPRSLLAEIRGEGTETGQNVQKNNRVFILFRLSPQQISHEIQNLLDAAEKGKNYVIATTDVPQKKWINTNQSLFWDTSITPPSYNPEDLASVLIYKLKEKIQKLNDKKILFNEIEIEEHIRRSISVQKKINYFSQIDLCFQSLLHVLLREKSISTNEIDSAVEDATQSRENGLKIWFNSLENRDKLLVIGLSLFDGLFEDQFFAALETVLRQVWQQRDPTLVALDYQDLEDLGDYYNLSSVTYYYRDSDGFKFVNTENYPTEFAISKIEIGNPNDRPRLLKVAWNTHRRQIMNALGAIVNIVKESVEQKPGNWELYGNDFRRSLLHNTVSQTLSDIGLGEISAASEVRNPLLELASHQNFKVNDVAAQAIAKWYIDYSTPGQLQRERFFGTLTQFWRIATQKQENDSDVKLWQKNIGATVAMTISYAAINASSSQEFKQDFLNWLQELSTHPSPIVRERFGYHTLFYLVPMYLDDLKETLKEWTQKYEELNHPIAVALARAYKEKPLEVKDLLEKWYNEAKQNMPKDKSDAPNERLLATVALTYGEIDYDNK
ncbi:MAG: hypothetical protein U7123_12220 [Potamolinea sp.]